MTIKKIRNTSAALSEPLELLYCESFFCRLKGLAWQPEIENDKGIVLVLRKEGITNSAIHMLGMSFDLAIIWLDKHLNVVDLRKARRWRSFLKPRRAAQFVIECHPSRIKEFSIGDKIVFEDF